jgi:tRNA(fMet)-specific endonuclease VapC
MAVKCAPHLDGRLAAISFQSVAELRHGAIKESWGEAKRSVLERAIRKFVVLIPDDATVLAWAELKAEAERQGLSKSAQDLWVAATAKRHALPLLTNDRGFLTGLGITVVVP